MRTEKYPSPPCLGLEEREQDGVGVEHGLTESLSDPPGQESQGRGREDPQLGVPKNRIPLSRSGALLPSQQLGRLPLPLGSALPSARTLTSCPGTDPGQ